MYANAHTQTTPLNSSALLLSSAVQKDSAPRADEFWKERLPGDMNFKLPVTKVSLTKDPKMGWVVDPIPLDVDQSNQLKRGQPYCGWSQTSAH